MYLARLALVSVPVVVIVYYIGRIMDIVSQAIVGRI